jgi:hypothetical protein
MAIDPRYGATAQEIYRIFRMSADRIVPLGRAIEKAVQGWDILAALGCIINPNLESH